MSYVLEEKDKQKPLEFDLMERLWVSRFDPNESCRELANRLWDENRLLLDRLVLSRLLTDILHQEGCVREAAAKALAEALKEFRQSIPMVLKRLDEIYKDKAMVSQT